MSKGCVRIALPLILALGVPQLARADQLYLVGGQYGANSSYAFLGAILPLPGNSLGHGFAARVWSDYLTYDYQSAGRKIDASAWGGELAGVYQFSGAWGWSDLSVGARYRDTSFSPDDPANRARGGRLYLTLGADGAYNIDQDWRIRGIATYTSTVTGYFLQPMIERAVSNTVWIGLDATFQGDQSYRQVYAGANASFVVSEGRIIAIRAGTMTSGGASGLYAGLTFVLTGN
jgi:hypothetical protein